MRGGELNKRVSTHEPARRRPLEGVAMTIELSRGGGGQRRVVLSCDAAGCPVRLEPPAAEQWRSDADARSRARDQAAGWTRNPDRDSDYCPGHAEFSTRPPVNVVFTLPTATIRNQVGDPLNRDEYAVQLRTRLAERSLTGGEHRMLTAAEADVVARLLDELAGVYRGEKLGALARELSTLLTTTPMRRD
jgi:hypothetical protein